MSDVGSEAVEPADILLSRFTGTSPGRADVDDDEEEDADDEEEAETGCRGVGREGDLRMDLWGCLRSCRKRSSSPTPGTGIVEALAPETRDASEL